MIGLIVNANAHRIQRDPALARRLSSVGEALTAVTASTDDVAIAMQRFALERVQAVAVCGGDGSVGLALRQLRRAFGRRPCPPLALLPGGTMNTIAANIQPERDPESALEQLLRDLKGGNPRLAAISTLLVNGKLCFMFGAAMAARFLEAYYQRRASVATAVSLAVQVPLSALFGTTLARRIFSPVAATMVADGKAVKGEWTLLVASTLRDFGLGVQITYRAAERPDRFQLVGSMMSARPLALQYPRTLRGLPLRGVQHHDLLAAEARVAFEQPQPIMTDGELQMVDHVELTMGPRIDLWVSR